MENKNIVGKALFAGMVLFIVWLIMTLTSCATPNQRKAVKHYKKSVKYGFKINEMPPRKIDTLIVVKETDSNGVTTSKIIPISIDCPPCKDVVFPLSKTEIRQKERTARIENRNERKKHISDNKKKVKIKKSDNQKEAKKNKPFNHFLDRLKWFTIGTCIGIVLTFCLTWFVLFRNRKK